MKVFGITGNICSGKSELTRYVVRCGFPALNADSIAKEITAEGTPGLAQIYKVFGSEFRQTNGELDRKKLRQLIMQQPNERKKLEEITHPLIKQRFYDYKEQFVSLRFSFLFYEAALLYEANAQDRVDKVVCVVADDAIRVHRLVKRDNLSEKQAWENVKAQMSQNLKAKNADYTIENNTDLETFQSKAQKLINEITNG